MIVNWAKIAKHAALLLLAQALLGFLEGSFIQATTVGVLLASSLISLIAAASIFTHLSFGEPSNPWAHAWLVLLIQVVAGTLLLYAVSGSIRSTPTVFLVADWVVLVTALLAGTSIGSVLRGRLNEKADA